MMALIFSGSGLSPSGVSLCPKNLKSVDLNWILSGLSDKLFIPAVLSRVSSLPSCWTSVSPCVIMSSTIPCRVELVACHHVGLQSLHVWICHPLFHVLLQVVWALCPVFPEKHHLLFLIQMVASTTWICSYGVLNIVNRLLTKSKTTYQ